MMMKFACLSETWAPPMRWPLRPARSMSSAACPPGGFVNTEPQLQAPIGWLAWRFSRSRLIDSVLASHRALMVYLPGLPEVHSWLYFVRLLAFLLILFAILDKNRIRER